MPTAVIPMNKSPEMNTKKTPEREDKNVKT